MAFTYDPELGTALDRVRFALGDTSETGALLEDETIQTTITARGEDGAIAYLAQGLATKLAYQPDSVSIPGGPSVRWSRVQALQAAASASGGAGAGAETVSATTTRGDECEAEYRRPSWW